MINIKWIMYCLLKVYECYKLNILILIKIINNKEKYKCNICLYNIVIFNY